MIRHTTMILLLTLFVLSACTTQPPQPAPEGGYSATGRLTLRQGMKNDYANFDWASAPELDRITFATPLGQIVAELEVQYQANQPVAATLRQGSEPAIQASSPDVLLQKLTGLDLPVHGLRWWLLGQVDPTSTATRQKTEDGDLIQQAGWDVLILDYIDSNGQRLPRKLELRRGEDLLVRIVISEWQWHTTP